MAQEPRHQPPSPAEFRRHEHALVDWIADYFERVESYPVLARVKPGEISAALPDHAPEDPEPFEDVMADFERVLAPGLTHWNHPGFLAYFPITGSAPGALAEFLAAALNQQAMLWRTSPAATELEDVALAWLRQLIGLPGTFEGVIYDTASIGALHALTAAREAAIRDVRAKGLLGRNDVPQARVYCSDQAHSSIDKAVITIGLGQESLRRIPSDDRFRMRADLLGDAVRQDRLDGVLPLAVVATVGRRPRRASIRFQTSPRCANANASGCTSTPRTAAWPRCCSHTPTCSPAPSAPTR